MELRFGSRLRENFKDFWRKLEKRVISKVNVIPISEKEAIIAGDLEIDGNRICTYWIQIS